MRREGNIKTKYFLEAGMIGYGVAATCFAGLAITLVIRRETGVLKRVRSTPLPPTTYLFAVLCSIFLVFLVEAFVIIGLGKVVFDVALPNRWISLLFVLLLGAGCFAALGFALSAFIRSAEGSSAVVNAVYLPMAIISGTFFTPKAYPDLLRWVAEALPLTHFTKLTRDVMVHNQHAWHDKTAIAVVFGWGVVGVVLAVRRFRWQPRENT
jgi:ABC-2 type transport system permease protein